VASPSWISHTVAQKETLFRISKMYDCKPSDILEWNNLKLEQGLTVGQKLKIFTNNTKSEPKQNGIKIEQSEDKAKIPAKGSSKPSKIVVE
jgi:LysM repeat protein